MIKSITIKNFRTHQDTKLDFCEGINIIVGESDTGKSNIVKAIRKLKDNHPSGDSFKGVDAPTEIIMEVINGDKIDTVSICVDKDVTYIVNGRKFNKCKQSVPDEVLALLNLSDINISRQFDKSFLVFDTPGEVGKRFNKILKMDKVELYLSTLTTKINKRNNDIESTTEEILNIRNKIGDYKYIEQIESKLNLSDTLHSRYLDCVFILNNLKSLIFKIGIAEEQYNKYISIVAYKNALDKLSENIDGLKTTTGLLSICNKKLNDLTIAENIINKFTPITYLANKLVKLQDIIKNLSELIVKIKKLSLLLDRLNSNNKIISKLQNINELNNLINNITSSVEQITKSKDTLRYLKTISKRVDLIDEYIELNTIKLDKYKGAYLNIIKSLNKCPLCMQYINDACLHRIEQTLND